MAYGGQNGVLASYQDIAACAFASWPRNSCRLSTVGSISDTSDIGLFEVLLPEPGGHSEERQVSVLLSSGLVWAERMVVPRDSPPSVRHWRGAMAIWLFLLL